MSDDDLDLRSLDDDELVQQMHDDLYDGLKEEIEESVNILLERGWTPYKILTEGLVKACASSVSTSATAFCSCRKCCWLPTP
jgi:methanogenic corrinoid protein MtbC1